MSEDEGWTSYGNPDDEMARQALRADKTDVALVLAVFQLTHEVRRLQSGLEQISVDITNAGPRDYRGVVLFQQLSEDPPEWQAIWKQEDETRSHEGADKEEIRAWAVSREAELWMFLDRGQWIVWHPDDADEPQP